MSENSFSKFDQKNSKAVFLLKRRSNQRTDAKSVVASTIATKTPQYNADL